MILERCFTFSHQPNKSKKRKRKIKAHIRYTLHSRRSATSLFESSVSEAINFSTESDVVGGSGGGCGCGGGLLLLKGSPNLTNLDLAVLGPELLASLLLLPTGRFFIRFSRLAILRTEKKIKK